jgi:peptidoglycan/xylan/chitin deacetylase (PgdA/CDA1 family)
MIARVWRSLLIHLTPRRLVRLRGPATGNAIYITFDDGPHAEHTPPLLDLLAAHQAKASFFIIGDQVEAHGPLVARIVAEGHRLGNHSWDHPRFKSLPLARQWRQIEDTDRAIARYSTEPILFRPPRGDISLRMLVKLARQRRSTVLWSYDSGDYRKEPVETLIARMRDKPPVAGDIVLFHDDGGAAIELLRALLPEWRARGLAFAALPREFH